MLYISKAVYMSYPAEQRKRHKDKSYWLRITRQHRAKVVYDWVQVVFHRHA